MSRWVRWYEGTTEDGKFRVVARLSRVTVRDVIALWAFILEDAGNLEHRGVCCRNEDFMASILDFEDGVVEGVLSAMETVGLISIGPGAITICNWGKRQFEGDRDPTAAERQARKRKRDKEEAPSSHGIITRDSRPPDTDTDTDTEKKEDAADAASSTYAFEAGIIRLTQKDFDKWKTSFSYLDVPAELTGLQRWAATQRDWFFAVSGALAKRNREIKAARDRPAVDANKAYWGNRTPGIL